MAFSSSSQKNRLLSALPNSVRQRWLPQLEWVCMPLGRVLHGSGQPLSHVYFPVTATVSLIYATSSGASSAVACIGCEGLVGVEAFMGGHSMPGQAVVQSEGYGFRLSAALVKKEFEGSSLTLQLLLRYTEALLVQIAQLAVCSRHHSLEQRLSRWLLWQLDHLHASEILATHERIANLLGVRRESVSEGLSKLQKLGVIRYGRGHVSVENRIGLEKQSCECAHVIKLAYEHLPTSDVGVVGKEFADTVVAATPPRLWREPVVA
jgi:CRP-like cAMP-binding protein